MIRLVDKVEPSCIELVTNVSPKCIAVCPQRCRSGDWKTKTGSLMDLERCSRAAQHC